MSSSLEIVKASNSPAMGRDPSARENPTPQPPHWELPVVIEYCLKLGLVIVTLVV